MRLPALPRPRSIKQLELLVLAVLSLVAHFWRLFTPRAVVFDEMHYKRFAGHYLDGTFYYDVHPPLGKLIFAGIAKLAGVTTEAMLGLEPVVALRVVPALLGSLIAPLAYVILRQLGGTRRVAAVAGFALLFENALLVETRFALLEPMMIGFGMVAVACFLASRERTGVGRWSWIVASGVASGCAIATKWTGASALAVVLAVWFIEALRERARVARIVREGLMLAIVPAAIYLATFAIHFELLPRAGPGLTLLRVRFRETLVGWPGHKPEARLSFFTKVAEVHDAMSRGNRSLENVAHPASSPWYTWPIMKHPIGFWQDTRPATGWQANIILLGNPVVWWGSLAVASIGLLYAVRRRELLERHGYALAFFFGGFFINFAPFIAIRRIMYLYHYLFALVFAAMLAAYCAGVLGEWHEEADDALLSFPSRGPAIGFAAALALIVIGFVYFLPFTYGWPVSQAAYDQRFWVLHPF